MSSRTWLTGLSCLPQHKIHGKQMGTLTGEESKSPDGLLYFQYDESCDLIGGESWDQALDRWLLSGLLPDRHQILATMAPRFSSPHQFHFSNDAAGYFPLEVLWVKWSLFSDLCRGVLTFHRDYKKPHLNIRPPNILITVPGDFSYYLPARWLYALKIDETASTSPYLNPEIPSESASRLFTQPQDPQSIYAAPVIREKTPGHEETVTVLIRSMERIRETEGGGVRGILQVHLISDNIRSSEYSDMDVFQVVLHFPDEKRPPLKIWGSKVASSEKGLSLKGTTDPVTPDIWKALEKASKSVFLNSKVAIYPSYHVPCDLYSLGMMLLRTLLVNDEHDLSEVAQTVRRIAGTLEPMVQGLDPYIERKTLVKRFKTRLMEEGRMFSKDSILFLQKDRAQSEGCPYIPDNIWYETLTLCFRLVTSVPGFSFCQDHGDYDIENPQISMEKVMEAVEGLRERIKIELFGSRRRNREILEVCDLVRRELAGRNVSDAI